MRKKIRVIDGDWHLFTIEVKLYGDNPPDRVEVDGMIADYNVRLDVYQVRWEG